MVSYKTQLIATILLISEAYSQFVPCGCGCPQRCGPTPAPSTGSIIPGCQFVVPAIIKPILPAIQPSVSAPSTPNKPVVVSSSACVDDDDDCELDKLLYLLISNIIENRKGCGKKQSSSSIVSESSPSSSAGLSDTYESYYASGYGDDYDYGGLPSAYATPVYGSGSDQLYTAPSCDNTCPEICVYVRPYSEC